MFLYFTRTLFLTTHLLQGPVWTTGWRSASCDWLLSGAAPSCGPELHLSAHPESERAATIKETHIRSSSARGLEMLNKAENGRDSNRAQPAASLQSQTCVHLMRWSLCWVCRGRGRPQWRLEIHTDTSPWDISSSGSWHPESSLWSKRDTSTMGRRDQYHQSEEVSVVWMCMKQRE